MTKKEAIEHLNGLSGAFLKTYPIVWSKGFRFGIQESIKVIDKLIPDDGIKVTKKMKEARDYVDSFIEKNGYSPTYEKVAEELGLKSTSVSYHRLRGYRHKMQTKQ